MARAFADISFTPSVKAAQLRYGSRDFNRNFENAEDPRNLLSEKDAAFIAERDSFYQATVGENGWPYVQHRGGEIGFVKIVNAQQLIYGDFSGNRQYISVGNMNANDRVSLIFMDYVNRRRLKIWGHASIIHSDDEPGILKALENTEYPAKIERAVVITIAAIEWNCPQHITQRFTAEEVKEILAPLIEENTQLKNRLVKTNP